MKLMPAAALLDADLALARRRNVDVLVGQNFRTAGLVNTNCRNHVPLPLLRAPLTPVRLKSCGKPPRRPGS